MMGPMGYLKTAAVCGTCQKHTTYPIHLGGEKHMNYRSLDWTRRNASPLELDLVEHYAAGKISRRDFVRRGVVLGIGATTLSSVIAACGGSGGSDGAVAAGRDTDTDTDTDSGSTDTDSGSTDTDTDTAAPAGQDGGVIVISTQPTSTGLDPVNMLDFAVYAHIAQTIEYLVGVGPDGNISPEAGLSTGWTPNDTLDVWTFDLRQGVKWHDGSDFTSADVAASMDRLVEAENAGLDGVIEAGSTDSSDPSKAVIQLINPNGNFPVLVSMFNSQSGITPADYELGTLLNERPVGTGPFMLTDYSEGEGLANFVRNPDWWGGTTPLDGVQIRQFEAIETQVAGVLSGDVDMIVDFDVLSGESLLESSEVTVLEPPSTAHRQVWFNTSNPNSQFTDVRLRKAMALIVDRPQLIEALYRGKAVLANDHPVISSLPFYDPDAVPQRVQDIEAAKALMAEAGVDELTTVCNVGDNQEIPQMAQLMASMARAAGINITVETTPQANFYSDSWCPDSGEGELTCFNSDEFGIVDWGNRPTPDVFLTSALQSDAVWNASVYANDEYDKLVTDYQGSADVEAQKNAIGKIQAHLHENVPALYCNFRNYLGAYGPGVTGAQVTALGQPIVSRASRV